MMNDPTTAASGGLSPDTIDAALVGTLKAAPAVAVTFFHTVLDVPVEKWVSVAVLVFTVLQTVVLIRREFLKRRGA